jgi:beta-N-acetylhexosaminidase
MIHRVTATGETTSLAHRKRRAGQRLIIGLPGPGVDPVTARIIRLIRPAGFILFARNIEEPAQVRELNRELETLLPKAVPPLLTVDQEGGRVQRVREGATIWPPLRQLGNCRDLSLTHAFAEAMADEVAALGFNVDWAPVADVDSNPKNPVIGDRSFGRDPNDVAKHVAVFVRAMQARGVMACAKHFPGHGDTKCDSHLELPVVEKDRPDIESVELPPFQAAVRAGVAMVMGAHVVFPDYDNAPATLSRRLLDEVLRQDLGHQGLVVSDDMEMKAIHGRFPLEFTLESSCAAGMDLFLFCKDQALQVEAYETLVRLQEQDSLHDTLATDSSRRLLTAREAYLKERARVPDLSVLGCHRHKDLARLIRARGGE